jgi:hypothetical protein
MYDEFDNLRRLIRRLVEVLEPFVGVENDCVALINVRDADCVEWNVVVGSNFGAKILPRGPLSEIDQPI